MARSWASFIPLLLSFQLAVGGLMFVVGVVIPPIRPEFQLDAVLTSEQWHDEVTRENTRTILKKLNSANNQDLMWTVFGVAITGTSCIGLWLVRKDMGSVA